MAHKCDLDIKDGDGNSLLHLAIMRGDSFAASFLIRKGASTILARKDSQETPIHMVATYNPSQVVMSTYNQFVLVGVVLALCLFIDSLIGGYLYQLLLLIMLKLHV